MLPAQRSQQLLTFSSCHSKNSFTSRCSLSRIFLGHFKNKDINILISTDVAARGIDVNEISAVLNYDIPRDKEFYTHRIGRTGRNQKEGIAYTLVIGDEQEDLNELMSYTRQKIDLMRHKNDSYNDLIITKKGKKPFRPNNKNKKTNKQKNGK